MSEFFRKWRQGSFVFLTDLSLLTSLCLAEFIVWRFLRRSRKENAARRKCFKLLSGQSSLSQAQSYLANRTDGPKAIPSRAPVPHQKVTREAEQERHGCVIRYERKR